MCNRMIFALLLFTAIAGFGVFVASGTPQSPQPQASPPQEAWQKELNDICSKTEDAMTFSEQELTSLIRRCDALLPQLEKLDETRKKIYVKRLKSSRGLYAYVLDSKKKEKE